MFFIKLVSPRSYYPANWAEYPKGTVGQHKSSSVAVKYKNCVRAVAVSCSGVKAGEVPQENIFIYSYNTLCVSKQGRHKLLSGAVCSRLQG